MEDTPLSSEESVRLDPVKETEVVFRCMAVVEDLNGRAIDILMHWLRVLPDEEARRRIEEHAEGYMVMALRMALDDMARAPNGMPDIALTH